MKYILTFIYASILLSCTSQKNISQNEKVKCPKIYKNNFTKILNEKYVTIVDNDTISYNEIRFECVFSSFYTQKVMFDRFGKWDKEIYSKNRKHPVLVWNDIDLLSNGNEYIVIAYGIEEWKQIFASVMIFDKEEKDILSDLDKRESITKLFSKMIKKNKTRKRDFYEVYWKMVDPERWKTIKSFENKY